MSVELKKIGIYSQHELGHSQGLDTPNKARDASTEPREAKLRPRQSCHCSNFLDAMTPLICSAEKVQPPVVW